MGRSVLLWAAILMSAGGDGASGFLPASSLAAQRTAGAPVTLTRPIQATAPPSPVLGLRGGMQDADDWGPPDVQHKYDLSRLVADPAEQVRQAPRAPRLVVSTPGLTAALVQTCAALIM